MILNRTKRLPTLTAVLVLAAGISLASRSAANVQEVCGISPKATAMGNAFTAVADDFGACYYNPAGLAQNDHHAFYLGYMYVQPKLRQYLVSAPGSVNESEENKYNGVVFGTIVDLTQLFNIQKHRFVLGVAATVADNFRAAWRIHDWDPSVNRFIRNGDYMNRAHIYSGVGYELLPDMLYIGGGINLTQDIKTSLRVKITLYGNLSNEVNSRYMDIDGDFEISPLAGLIFKPTDWLSIGYAYKGAWEQKTPIDILAVVNNVDLGGVQVPIYFPIATQFTVSDYYLPWNMTLGLALRPIERLLVTADLTFYNWSDFQVQLWREPVKEWRDTWVPRFGAEFQVLDGFFARVGYYYEPSPVPDQSNVSSNYLDSAKHAFSAGVGYSFSSVPFIGELPFRYPVTLEAFFQYQRHYHRRQEKLAQTGQESWFIKGYQYGLGFGVTTGF